MILIAPTIDPERHGGIERVSREMLNILPLEAGPHLLLVSNDNRPPADLPEATTWQGFDGRYIRMMFQTARLPLEPWMPPILCMHAGLSPVARVLGVRTRMPYRVFLHGIEVWRRLPLRTRWGLAGASGFLANSEYTLARFRREQPRFRDVPGRVIHLGLAARFQGLEPNPPAGAPQGRRFILSVSRLSQADDYKGHGVLMDAVLDLRRRKVDVVLVVVGTGDAEQQLRARAASCPDPDAVVLIGRVGDPELLWLYQHCELFALLSDSEGFGLVFVEAMAQGKPCVCTGADAAREIVVNAETGFVVPPGDPAAAAEAMGRLLEHPDLAARMGEAGCRRVGERFMPEHFARRMRQALGGS